jgi:hypothetical protein
LLKQPGQEALRRGHQPVRDRFAQERYGARGVAGHLGQFVG